MSRITPVVTTGICLTEGDAVQIAAPTTTGASATTWTVPPPISGAPGRDVILVPDGLSSMTTLTADLECSSDGGTTWDKFKTSLALIATSTAAAVVVSNLPPSLIYRLNVTTFSGTSAKVTASVS